LIDFLQTQIPFNLNLAIQDLPTGQLAEAQITSFDPSGRPNGGTLLIDTDANQPSPTLPSAPPQVMQLANTTSSPPCCTKWDTSQASLMATPIGDIDVAVKIENTQYLRYV
jgi:hypothetical protein